MGLFATIIVGLVAGWLASLVMKAKTSIWIDLVLGVAGSIVGGLISSLITGVNMVSGVNLTSIIVSLIGAIIVLAVYRFLRKGRK
jgi:uncharacterized membrane protein YeaQ/YmgE (transglycosylase-associated protein family)